MLSPALSSVFRTSLRRQQRSVTTGVLSLYSVLCVGNGLGLAFLLLTGVSGYCELSQWCVWFLFSHACLGKLGCNAERCAVHRKGLCLLLL